MPTANNAMANPQTIVPLGQHANKWWVRNNEAWAHKEGVHNVPQCLVAFGYGSPPNAWIEQSVPAVNDIV
jgi:hypothetical protein